MVGAVIIAHGSFGAGLKDAAEIIFGEVSNLEVITVGNGDSTDEISLSLEGLLNAVSSDGGTIIFTDMFGGTPMNIALQFLDGGGVEVMTGVNLPIIIKFLNSRDNMSASELVGVLKECGIESIVPASEILNEG